jgi:hypothetical protein
VIEMKGYTAWRNWFLGKDPWAPKKFKNLGSGSKMRRSIKKMNENKKGNPPNL